MLVFQCATFCQLGKKSSCSESKDRTRNARGFRSEYAHSRLGVHEYDGESLDSCATRFLACEPAAQQRCNFSALCLPACCSNVRHMRSESKLQSMRNVLPHRDQHRINLASSRTRSANSKSQESLLTNTVAFYRMALRDEPTSILEEAISNYLVGRGIKVRSFEIEERG